MAEKKIREIVKFFVKCLRSGRLRVSKIVLFGSGARARAGHHRDLDILIVSESFRGKNLFQRAELTKEAEIKTIRKFLVPLDVATLTPEEYRRGNSLIAEYAREGRVVYAA